nr:phospho-N-acetylmuramoyl-pentapeptide-transferase [Ligilactobacillus ceti]
MNYIEWLSPMIISFILTVVGLPLFIDYAHRKKQGQMIRDEGPKWHEVKSGTPTMGGLVFNIAIIIASLVVGILFVGFSPQLLILVFILFMYGVLGFWDDSIKLWKKQNEGLTAKQKLIGQIFAGVIFFAVYYQQGLPLAVNVFGYELYLGWFYLLFVIFWLVGFSNAVNLTDGIDGLVAGQASIAFLAYAIIAYVQHQTGVLIFCMAVVGGLLAFLIFNHKPAKIFMGDMGSLALGGALAGVSILLHHELSLLLIGIIFVCETASVILQVISFKTTGKRIFKMSPIHHHFEMCGWSEWKIDIVFWSIGAIAAIISVVFAVL